MGNVQSLLLLASFHGFFFLYVESFPQNRKEYVKESESHFEFMVTFLKNKGDKKADSVTCIGKRKREILPAESLWVLGSRKEDS